MGALYERGSGGHVAERVRPEPGSPEADELERLADDPSTAWRRVVFLEPTTADDVKAPAKSATKPEWVAYAVAQGAVQADAEALTTRQLIEQYGPTD
jgi:hypothetical protein